MKALLTFCCCIFLISVRAQHDSIPPGDGKIHVGGSVQYGFLWAHRYSMGNLVKAHIGAAELDIFKNSNGDQPWEKSYYYPQFGFAFVAVPLGNPDQLGSAWGFYPYINFPLSNRAKNFKWHFRYGWGIGYLTKKFDPLENHQNVAIGSHFNTCFSLRLNGDWKLNERSAMNFGIGITHFSNGCVTMPNLGLNIPLLSVGYSCRISSETGTTEQGWSGDRINDRNGRTVKLLSDRSWHFYPFVVFGLNDTDPPGGKKFGVANFLFSAMKQTSPKARWLAGFDIMCSQGIRDRLLGDGKNVTQAQAIQYGVKGGYEMVIGRISLPLEIGAYVHTMYKENGPVYTRFGVHYLASRNLVLCFNLKTHFARAEYWEVGFAYRI